MNTIGIVAEYNPFHNGHALQLHTLQTLYPHAIRIVVMSGDFVQRGEPALFSKFDRAKWALLGGADIILELPSLFALSSAEYFAGGAIRLLGHLGVDGLAFGSEFHHDPDIFMKAIQIMDSLKFKDLLQAYLGDGFSYSTALRQSLNDADPSLGSLLQSPNSLLGLEYVRAIHRYNLSIKPIPLPRQDSHHSKKLNPTSPSGSAIRHIIQERTSSYVKEASLTKEFPYQDNSIDNSLSNDFDGSMNNALNGSLDSSPDDSLNNALDNSLFMHAHTQYPSLWEAFPTHIAPLVGEALEQGHYINYKTYYQFLLYAMRTSRVAQLSQCQDMGEGFEYSWQKASALASWKEAEKSLKSKRYTYARIRRIGANLLLQRSRDLCHSSYETGPLYGRLLGFSDRGRLWLHAYKKREASEKLPIITKFASFYNNSSSTIRTFLDADVDATNLHALCMVNEAYRGGLKDFTTGPILI